MPPPQRAAISPQLRRAGLRISTCEGMVAQAHSALTGLGISGNAVTVGFALWLGATDIWLGVCAAIPALASAAQLLSSQLAPRMVSRRIAVIQAATLARCMWLCCAVAGLLLGPGKAALYIFMATWAVANVLMSFSGNMWVSWMADLCPPMLRARYFAIRTSACTAVGMGVGLAGGAALDWAGEQQGVVFSIIFVLASLAGLGCGALLFRQPEPVRQGSLPQALALGAPFVRAFRTPTLRGILTFVVCFGAANGLAIPFWQPYQLEQLQLSFSAVNGWVVAITGVSTAASLPLWARLASRVGHRGVVAACIVLITSHPLYYMVATPQTNWLVYIDSISAGVAWGGYNVSIFNLVLAAGAGPRMEQHFAVYSTLAGLSQGAASLLSGTVAQLLPTTVHLAGFPLDRRQAIFLVTFVVRVGCLVVFAKLVPKAKPSPFELVMAALPTAVRARMTDVKFMVVRRRQP